MGIFAWIIMGLLAGVLAKWIMPGPDGGGFFKTMFLGIGGGLLGGFIGNQLGWGRVDSFELTDIFLAVVGSLLVLGGFRLLRKKG
jgi:uncharacterized membrane protein YeaQ/YmgE (transglycosylase-associated protein family)